MLINGVLLAAIAIHQFDTLHGVTVFSRGDFERFRRRQRHLNLCVTETCPNIAVGREHLTQLDRYGVMSDNGHSGVLSRTKRPSFGGVVRDSPEVGFLECCGAMSQRSHGNQTSGGRGQAWLPNATSWALCRRTDGYRNHPPLMRRAYRFFIPVKASRDHCRGGGAAEKQPSRRQVIGGFAAFCRPRG